jgi:hypothetical protein
LFTAIQAIIVPFTLIEGEAYAVASSTPGRVRAILRTVSNVTLDLRMAHSTRRRVGNTKLATLTALGRRKIGILLGA